jgi:hypothetical protein
MMRCLSELQILESRINCHVYVCVFHLHTAYLKGSKGDLSFEPALRCRALVISTVHV